MQDSAAAHANSARRSKRYYISPLRYTGLEYGRSRLGPVRTYVGPFRRRRARQFHSSELQRTGSTYVPSTCSSLPSPPSKPALGAAVRPGNAAANRPTSGTILHPARRPIDLGSAMTPPGVLRIRSSSMLRCRVKHARYGFGRTATRTQCWTPKVRAGWRFVWSAAMVNQRKPFRSRTVTSRWRCPRRSSTAIRSRLR